MVQNRKLFDLCTSVNLEPEWSRHRERDYSEVRAKTHLSLSQDVGYDFAVENRVNGSVPCANLEAIGAQTSNSAITFSRYPDGLNYMEPVGIRYLIVNRWH